MRLSICLLCVIAGVRGKVNEEKSLQQDSSDHDLLHLPLRRLPSSPLSPSRRLEDMEVTELFQGYGTHYIDLWVGTPPQRQTLIVDTGSSTTAFPCEDCTKECDVHHVDRIFTESDSSSYYRKTCDDKCVLGKCSKSRENTCTLHRRYAEGSSWNAVEATDTAYFGGPHDHALDKIEGAGDWDPLHAKAFQFELTFGCQYSITKLFVTQLADGITGFDLNKSSAWYQLYKQNIIKKQAFSMCFSRKNQTDKEGTEAGALTLGGTDERLHDAPMEYVAIKKYDDYYGVHIKAMYLKSKEHESEPIRVPISEEHLNSGTVIVDSGSTSTYFSKKLRRPFNEIFQRITGRPFSDYDTIKLTPQEVDQLPTVVLQLKAPNKKTDILLEMPPQHYMEYYEDEDVYGAGIMLSNPSDGTLGANFMMGYDVHFDVDNNQVGFALSNCEYTKLVKEAGLSDDGEGDNFPSMERRDDVEDALDEKEASLSADKTRFRPDNGEFENRSVSPVVWVLLFIVGSVAGVLMMRRRSGQIVSSSARDVNANGQDESNIEMKSFLENAELEELS